MRLKPARPGLVIRDPYTQQALPDEGGDVPETTFWHRRIADGDAVVVPDEKPQRAPAKRADKE